METSKIEFIIKTDSKGQPVELEDMNLITAKSLNIFLSSLLNIIDLMPIAQKAGISVQVLKGSACIVAEGPPNNIGYLEDDFEKVTKAESKNKDLVSNWRNIQNLVIENGLTYEINFVDSKKIKKPVIQSIKTSKQFRTKSSRSDSEFKLEFFKGKLIAVGGINPNFHLLQDDNEIIIHCDEINAKKINSFLYNDVLVSAWSKINDSSKISYQLSDIYLNDEFFNYLNDFYKNIENISFTEEFELMHDQFRFILEHFGKGHLSKFIKTFNHESTNISTLKSILILSKSFKSDSDIKEIREDILKLTEKKVGKKIV